MTSEDRLIGDWKPASDGEKLLHFLVRNAGEFGELDHLHNGNMAGISRGRQFMFFAEGAIALHCFGRLLQVAKHYRKQHLDQAEMAVKAIEEFVVSSLGIARATCRSFQDLAPQALMAAKAASDASKVIARSEKQEVLRSCNNVFTCYSCGGSLDPNAAPEIILKGKQVPNPASLEYEHLWPHSFGGNSIASNILPACPYCNRTKNARASWEWTCVQAAIPEFFDVTAPVLDGESFTKEVKIGLHMRAAMGYARRHGTTLKEAYLCVGPRMKLHLLDPNDTGDFFNLRVHDAETTGVNWEF